MKYSIVIPVYKSSKTLPILNAEILATMKDSGYEYEILYVDDCSPDDSWSTLLKLQAKHKQVRILRLGNNVGQWMASLAGISRSRGDYIITIDDDLEYETTDIMRLIEYQKEHNSDLVYGIPLEKKNKNLSYKVFFTLRDAVMRAFFSKKKTESFKIFRRAICFDEKDRMRSFLHFEALTKFVVAEQNTHYINVGYRKRHEGQSNHTLWMKIRILDKYGIEYFKAPFRYFVYSLLLFSWIVLAQPFLQLPIAALVAIKAFIVLLIVVMIGVLGKYLSSIYFKIKRLPEFIIIEEQ